MWCNKSFFNFDSLQDFVYLLDFSFFFGHRILEINMSDPCKVKLNLSTALFFLTNFPCDTIFSVSTGLECVKVHNLAFHDLPTFMI